MFPLSEEIDYKSNGLSPKIQNCIKYVLQVIEKLKTIWNHILKTSECDYVEFLCLDLLVSIRWSLLMVNNEVCRCRGRAPSLNASSCILVAISLSPSFVKNKKKAGHHRR